MSSLELTLLYLCAAVVSVVACRLLQLPAMLGYLFAGVVIGPNALALAKDSAAIEHLAEFGVVFLMFVIGLEFNLPKLMRMRKLVFGLGLGQVLFTLVGALLFNLAVGFALKELGYLWRLSWQRLWPWAVPWPCRARPLWSSSWRTVWNWSHPTANA